MAAVQPFRAFMRGVGAGAAALAIMGVARLGGLVPFPPELIALRLFEVVPVGTFVKVAEALGGSARWVAFGLSTVAALLAAGAVGLALAVSREQDRFRLNAAGCSVVLTGLILLLCPVLGIDVWRGWYPYRLILPAPVGFWLGSFVYVWVWERLQLAAWVVRSA
ncbi:MAG TPA: hypothetical protein VK101_07160 [Limnochordia bacterium]|nr:hypothetical protein [Limnochordia bacterium]